MLTYDDCILSPLLRYYLSYHQFGDCAEARITHTSPAIGIHACSTVLKYLWHYRAPILQRPTLLTTTRSPTIIRHGTATKFLEQEKNLDQVQGETPD